jgi:hypothetical protein
MWQCLECGLKVEDDTLFFCQCGAQRVGRIEVHLDEQPKAPVKAKGTASIGEGQPGRGTAKGQSRPQEKAPSMERAIALSLLAIILPNLGVMLAGLELGYRKYRFGAILLSLTFVQLVLIVLLGLLFR